MHTYKMFEPYAAVDKPLCIIEYDDNGNPFCAYKGFYRPGQGCFKLYPVAGNFVNQKEEVKLVRDTQVIKAQIKKN